MNVKDDTENIIVLAALGVVGYLLYQAYSGASTVVNAVGQTTTAAGNSIGSALFNFFNPGAAGSAVTYNAYLPNGSIAAVNSNSVATDGTTTIGGTTYQMYVDPTITTGINKTLVPTS